MDIPETGAVFTLGKSYLSENHQSYFFIKNDPIKKVIAGDNQSAVICESGRLFVWGENQYGQLSAGSKEVVTKPSCVKEIKNLGYKVRNIAFGGAFSVILTENNKVFFNGKSIFATNETYGGKFRNLDNIAHCIIRHNYEFIDFHKRCFDDQGNLDDLVDIVAGRTHFVVLTNSGKLYCYGFFEVTKVKRQKPYIEPRRISEHLVTRIAKCGTTFVVFVTDCNGVYSLGKLNGIEYTRATKLNTSDVRDSIYSIYVSQKDEIFLISSSGDVYKSTNDSEIQFERIILFNQNDNIRKFCSGGDFVCVLTDKNKFLTTFNEKASARNNTIGIRPPHELRKFQDLRILDIAAGLHHILLFAVSRISPSISLDITSSDPNENIPIRRLAESDASVKSAEDQKRKESIDLKHQNTSDFKNIVSPRPILTKETLEAIQADVPIDTIEPIEEPIVSKTETFTVALENLANIQKEEPTKLSETFEVIDKSEPAEINESVKSEKVEVTEIIEVSDTFEKSKEIEKTEKTDTAQTNGEIVNHTNETVADKDTNLESISKEPIPTMDMITKSVSNLGDNLMNDIKSIANAGEEKLNDLAKETEKTIKEVPKNVIDYVKTSVGLEKEEADNVLDAIMDGKENATKEIPKTMTDPMISNDNPPMQNVDSNEPDDNAKVKHNNKLNRALAEDDSNKTVIDDFKDDAADNEVKFINNGIDVSSTSNILQAMKDEMNEMSNDVKNKSDELTMKYDGIVNDELNATKEAASNKIFQMKNAGKDIMKDATTASADLMTRFIPLKHDLEEVDLEADGDTEQTTASIKSVSTPAKNQLEMDEAVDTMQTVKETDATTPKEEGRVKKFFNDIKNNCKTADTVVEMEQSAMQQVDQIKNQAMIDIDNKTSKVCTIL